MTGDAELIFSALHDLVNQLADDLNTVPSEMFQFISVLQGMVLSESFYRFGRHLEYSILGTNHISTDLA